MSRLRLPPRALDDGKEANSGRGQMVLLPARTRSASARLSSRLVVLPPPRATPSAVGALVAPRRCCGESRTFRTRTMKGNKSSRTKTKTQNKGQPKALFLTVDFSKVDPLYKCRSVSFYREVDGLFTFREHPCVKRIKTECARLSSGNLQLGLHVIGAS
jgi:hypothetical protein